MHLISLVQVNGLWVCNLYIIVLFYFVANNFFSSTKFVHFITEKETGQEFAAKIIDLSDSSDASILEATQREIQILRMVAGHPYISKYFIGQLNCYYGK